jgi:hypothetical protein
MCGILFRMDFAELMLRNLFYLRNRLCNCLGNLDYLDEKFGFFRCLASSVFQATEASHNKIVLGNYYLGNSYVYTFRSELCNRGL